MKNRLLDYDYRQPVNVIVTCSAFRKVETFIWAKSFMLFQHFLISKAKSKGHSEDSQTSVISNTKASMQCYVYSCKIHSTFAAVASLDSPHMSTRPGAVQIVLLQFPHFGGCDKTGCCHPVHEQQRTCGVRTEW